MRKVLSKMAKPLILYRIICKKCKKMKETLQKMQMLMKKLSNHRPDSQVNRKIKATADGSQIVWVSSTLRTFGTNTSRMISATFNNRKRFKAWSMRYKCSRKNGIKENSKIKKTTIYQRISHNHPKFKIRTSKSILALNLRGLNLSSVSKISIKGCLMV